MSRLRGLVVLIAFALIGSAPLLDPGPTAPILILVSFDGWRWDYINRLPAANLKALAARGVRATKLIPSFPVLTFPNHYTIVTGLYPEHHGIVANTMRDASMPERFAMSADTQKDARWWGGEPVWVTAIRQGLRAATMLWPGSEAAIGGVRPTYAVSYEDRPPRLERVRQVLAWLSLPESERPAFVSLYFAEVDDAGHNFGPDSAELAAAVGQLDEVLGVLIDGVHRLGLDDRASIVVVSDHGMTPASYDRVIYLDALIDLDTVEVLESGATLQLTPRDGDVDGLYRRLHGKHPRLAIYTRANVPARLHLTSNRRIPAIIGVPDAGWSVSSAQRLMEQELHLGTHGYTPATPDMGALFVAAGPVLRRGLVVAPFENIHVYDLLCALLRIAPAKNDGQEAVTRRFLRSQP
jgi:predicted AlkP superfamily pyrophosphatase or phosphodiesterase